MAIVDTRLTYEHLRQLPDDGKRYEIVNGELLVSPSPNRRHQETVGNVYDLLRRAQQAGFGKAYFAPFDVIFDQHNVTQPDVLFIGNERLGIPTEDNIQGAPDIVVEVLSPGTRLRDEGVKLALYASMRVRYYLMPDPTDQVVHRHELTPAGFREMPLLRAGDTLSFPMFPGISIDVAELFR